MKGEKKKVVWHLIIDVTSGLTDEAIAVRLIVGYRAVTELFKELKQKVTTGKRRELRGLD